MSVRFFLLVYLPRERRLESIEAFGSHAEALAARFAVERERLEDVGAGLEVVVVGATDEATLRQTHGRYFDTTGEVVRRLRDTMHVVSEPVAAPV